MVSFCDLKKLLPDLARRVFCVFAGCNFLAIHSDMFRRIDSYAYLPPVQSKNANLNVVADLD
jgi:hypothetical protein